MKLRVTTAAANDLRAVSLHVREHNPDAAQQMGRAVRDVFKMLAAFPYLGRLLQEGVRRVVLGRFPYLIYYEIDENAAFVSVLAIRHASRERPL